MGTFGMLASQSYPRQGTTGGTSGSPFGLLRKFALERAKKRSESPYRTRANASIRTNTNGSKVYSIRLFQAGMRGSTNDPKKRFAAELAKSVYVCTLTSDLSAAEKRSSGGAEKG